jgi:hydroxyethylthiazole kinase-like uncharacterized protein yjeF
MNILSAAQFKWLDQCLMDADIQISSAFELTVNSMVKALVKGMTHDCKIAVFCGTGNNGADGFAIARCLNELNFEVTIFLVPFGEMTPECHHQFEMWPSDVVLFNEQEEYVLDSFDVIIDAIMSTGLNRKPEGVLYHAIQTINEFEGDVFAIDLPTGLTVEKIIDFTAVVTATSTLSYYAPKLSFFMPESAFCVGNWEVVDSGLLANELAGLTTRYHVLTEQEVRTGLPNRNRFSNKGTYGHGLLIGGSLGKIGAIQLSARACLRSGIGLLTVHLPHCGIVPIQTNVPEAMVIPDIHENQVSDLTMHQPATFQSIGIGPGMGISPTTLNVLKQVLEWNKPTVIDADALNALALYPDFLELLPVSTVLTPHPKEFERLAGKSVSGIDRLERLQHFSQTYRCVVILKDAITSIALPSGQVYFNISGNPGMATGGAGDVLTGIVTGLLAQGFSDEQAAKTSVFFHGFAGDCAKEMRGERAIIASDLIEYLRIERF